MLIENNWNVERHDLCECQVGDMYRPWYYFKTARIGVPQDVPASCLVYWIGEGSAPTRDIACTSFQIDYRGKDKVASLNLQLAEDIKKNGQINRIDCIAHSSNPLIATDPSVACGAVTVPGLIEDPLLDFAHVFEGHHRLMACEHLGVDVGVRNYRVYDMVNFISLRVHYNSIYLPSFWSGWAKPHQRKPWFSYESFSGPLTATDPPVAKCFEFIKTLDIPLTRGVDIGCAEGLHTLNAASYLKIPMHGVDMEPGRILRALMIRHRDKRWDTSFRAGAWGKCSFADYDFVMLFSVMHHCGGQIASFEKFTKAAKVVAIEVRVAPDWTDVSEGSIKQIGPLQFYEDLFVAQGFKFQNIHAEGDRRWYVLWRK